MREGHPSIKSKKKTKASCSNTQHDNSDSDTAEFIQLANSEADGYSRYQHKNADLYNGVEKMGLADAHDLESDGTVARGKTLGRLKSAGLQVLIVLLELGIWLYIGFSLHLNPGKSVFVCIMAPFVTLYLVNKQTGGRLMKVVRKVKKHVGRLCKTSASVSLWMRRLSTVGVIIAIFVFLIIDIWDDWQKWVPLGGLAALVGVSVLGSKKPSKINWTIVIWGIILQFTMGLLILRWNRGFKACQWVGDQVVLMLSYTDLGSVFVFGEKYTDHPVAFKILPTVVFFSSIVSVLYYLGAMQALIKSIAAVLQFFLNTTPIVSFATAAHIFIGQVESSVALKPFWTKLTDSELHAIVTSGFATVAGTMIAAYVEFGIPAEHVISASFMSAPAAIAIAYISFPETEVSQIKTQKAIKLPSGQESNLLEALSAGATVAIKLVAFVVVNLIAFLAIFGFLDATLSYLGERVNCPQLSFQLICSYVLMPVAAVIGIPWSETDVVGVLIGKKIFLSEFLAYADLGTMLKAGEISHKSAVLSTYILCGFGSVTSLGINLGSLTSAAPDMRPRFSRLLLRGLINGNITCFMTACVAGLLYQDSNYAGTLTNVFNSTVSLVNSTTVSNIVTST